MTTKNMLIIKDARGEIIAAQVEDPYDSEVVTFINPAREEHTLHRVSDVPAEIHNLANPAAFHKAITDHVKSGKTKITQTNVDELHAAFASRSKK
jgi:NAD-dependent SIR2 family protein deacetylase